MQSGGARRTHSAGAEEGRAQVEPAVTWSDLVLPEPQRVLLEAATASVEAGNSIRLLFTGGPGTGKTLACQILGATVDAPVFSLDLSDDSSLESETVEELLRAAGRASAVVVFDHADLLLRGRQESRGSGEAMSATALLERVRDHGGAVVFTSSATRGIKEKLLDEFDSAVDFPFPDREAREEIWRRLLPGDAQLRDEDLHHLAESFQLAGAAIRTCCTDAILTAEAEGTPLTLAHVSDALELEYRDRLAGQATLAALAELRRRAGVEDAEEEVPSVDVPDAAQAQRRRRPVVRLPRLRLPRLRLPARRLHVPRAPVLALLAAIVAAGLGFLVGKATSDHASPPSKHASIGLGTIAVPTAWHRQAPPASLRLGLASEMGLAPARSADRMLVIGSGATTAPSFLPSSLLASLPAPPTPQIVRLGLLQFYRYQILSAPGQAGAETVYVLPTTGGTIVGNCIGPGLSSGFDSACQGVLATLRLSTAAALSLTPSASYTSELDHILFPLNLARLAGTAQLIRASSPRGVAHAAGGLAAAHAAAAASLRGLDAGVASAANTALANAFTQTADAYRALARAALHANHAAYGRAQADLSHAGGAVATAYAELRSLGYRVG